MTCLYGGKVLRVDLSTRTVHSVATERYTREYLGGRGLGVGLLFQSDVARPTGKPESAFCLAAGALTGTFYPGCPRTDVMWASTATQRVGHAGMVGGWAAELKQAGWDAVVLDGRADRPVYVSVRNEAVQVRDADEIWGASYGEARDLIRQDLDSPDAHVAGIGPAGEREVAAAAIQHGLGSASGDPGSGAALGSQNCKAIAVRGTRGVRLADPPRFFDLSLAAHRRLRSSSYYEQVHASGGRLLPGGWEIRPVACGGCPVACRDNYRSRGQGAVVLPREARDQLWPDLRSRDSGLWCEFVRHCEHEGVAAEAMAPMLRWLVGLGEQGLLPRRLTDGLFPWDGGRESLRQIMRATTRGGGLDGIVAAGLRAAADSLDAEVPAAARGGRSTYEYAAPFVVADVKARRNTDIGSDSDAGQAALEEEAASVVAALVGGCEDLASAWHGAARLDDYAIAISAGLGRAVQADDVLRAAASTRRLERVLECKVRTAHGAVSPPVTTGERRNSRPLLTAQENVVRDAR